MQNSTGTGFAVKSQEEGEWVSIKPEQFAGMY